MSLSERIKAYAHQVGFDLIGITPATASPNGQAYTDWIAQGFAGEMGYLERGVEKRQHPDYVLPGVRSLIVVAMNYRCPDAEAIPDDQPRGKIAQYARGLDYHDVMKEKLLAVLEFTQREANEPVQGKVYVDTGPILERDFAARAGLGWYGKHTNLIHKRMGSWLLLGEVLVDIELDYDRPATAHCGTCTLCLEACPTEAIIAPYVVDARKCISYHTIELKGPIPDAYRSMMGNRIFGCDDCQDVCPWNRRAPVTQESTFLPRPWTELPGLIELLQLTPETFRTYFKGSPIKRSKRRGLLRNTAVALGNTKDPNAVPVLIKALHDEEPLVRSHVAWALGQIGNEQACAALEQASQTETDTEVLDEIEKALHQLTSTGTAHRAPSS